MPELDGPLRRPTTVTTVDGRELEVRLERRERDAVVMFHGGHMRAELSLGESTFADRGWTVLAPSRPGYGKTPLAAGPDPSAYVDRVAELCRRLGLLRVVAAGTSAGGRTAMTMAARHPELVAAVVLESATSFLPWPDPMTRAGGTVVFNRFTERVTWALFRGVQRIAGDAALKAMLGSLSVLPPSASFAGFSPPERARLRELFGAMRSGSGFVQDLVPVPDVTADIRQPTLVVASRNDKGVDFRHALELVATIERATLAESTAASHLLWFGEGSGDERVALSAFLDALPKTL